MSSETGPRPRRGDPFQSAAEPQRNPEPDLGPRRPPAHLPKPESFLQQLRRAARATFHGRGRAPRLLLCRNRARREPRGRTGETEAGNRTAGRRPGRGLAGQACCGGLPRGREHWALASPGMWTPEGQRAGRDLERPSPGKGPFPGTPCLPATKAGSVPRRGGRALGLHALHVRAFHFPPGSGHVGRDRPVAGSGGQM